MGYIRTEYQSQLLKELREANNPIGYNTSESKTVRKSRIKELKRLGVKIPKKLGGI